MTTTLNKETYKKTLDEDLEWLAGQPHSLERDHLLSIVRKEKDSLVIYSFCAQTADLKSAVLGFIVPYGHISYNEVWLMSGRNEIVARHLIKTLVEEGSIEPVGPTTYRRVGK